MEVKVKRLEATDALQAVSVVRVFYAKEVSPQHMERFLSNPANYLIVAEADGNSHPAWAGFLLAYALERLKEDALKMFIYDIEVAEQYRRQGVGTALIGHVRRIVKQEEMVSAFVFTNYSNEGAVGFYKSSGAKIVNGDDLLFVYSRER